jgi:hypothetical protein
VKVEKGRWGDAQDARPAQRQPDLVILHQIFEWAGVAKGIRPNPDPRRTASAAAVVEGPGAQPTLAEELWQHRRRTHYGNDTDRVFCHAESSGSYRVGPSGAGAQERLQSLRCRSAAGIWPMHDLGRVTSITDGVRVNEHGSRLRRLQGTRVSRRRSAPQPTSNDATSVESTLTA